MKNKIHGAFKPTLLGAFFSSIACPVIAADDISLFAGAGLEAHDNASLANSNEKSDTKRLVNTEIDYKNNDDVFNVNLGYRAEYGDYQHNAQGDETAINGKS